MRCRLAEGEGLLSLTGGLRIYTLVVLSSQGEVCFVFIVVVIIIIYFGCLVLTQGHTQAKDTHCYELHPSHHQGGLLAHLYTPEMHNHKRLALLQAASSSP